MQYNKDTGWGGFIVDIYKAKKGIVDVSNEATKFFDKTKNWKNSSLVITDEKKFDSFIKKMNLSDESLIKFLEDTNYGTKDLTNYQEYLKKAGGGMTFFEKATKKASGILKGFGAMLGSMAINWAIGEVIGLAATAIDKEANRVEYAQERLEEFNNTVSGSKKKLEDQQKWIKENGSRYEELARGVDNYGHNVSLTADEFSEYQSITKDIADMFPNMISGYNDQNDAIIKTKGNVDALTESYKENIRQAYASTLAKSSETYNDYKDAISLSKNQKKYLSELISGKVQLKNISAIDTPFVNDGENGFQKEMVDGRYTNIVTGINTDILSEEVIEEIKKETDGVVKTFDQLSPQLQQKIRAVLTTANSTITSETTKVKPILEAFIYGEDGSSSGYGQLSEDGKQAIRNVISSLDDTFYSQFDSDTEMAAYFKSYFIEPLKDGLDNSDLAVKINTLFSIDKNDYSSYKEYVDAVLAKINELKNYKDANGNPIYSDDQIESLKKTFGVSDVDSSGNTSGTSLINEIKDKYSEINGAEEYIDTLNEKELRVLYELKPDEIKSLEAMRQSVDKINQEAEKQTDKSANSSTKSFSEVWNSKDNKSSRKKLEKLAKSGELTKDTIQSVEDYKNMWKSTSLEIDDFILKIKEGLTLQDKISMFSKDTKKVGTAYKDYKKNGYVSSNSLNSMPESFKNLDGYTKFNKTVRSKKTSSSQKQSAFNDIVSEYLSVNKYLDDLSSETSERSKKIITTSLKDAGIRNAEEVVESYIQESSKTKDQLTSLSKQTNKFNEKEFKSFVEYISKKGKVSSDFVKQIGTNNANIINGLSDQYKDDLTNWLELCRKKKEAYNLLAKAVGGNSVKESKSNYKKLVGKDESKLTSEDMGAYEAATKAGFYTNKKGKVTSVSEEKEKKAFKELKITPINADFKLDYHPTTSIDDGSKKDKVSESTQVIDWISRRLEVLQSVIDRTSAKFNNLFTYTQKKNNINKQIKETISLLNAQYKAADKYQTKADRYAKKSSLNKKIISQIQNGSIKGDVSTLIREYGENKANKITKLQDYIDKAKDARDATDAIRKSIYDLNQQKLDLRLEYNEDNRSLYDAKIENSFTATGKNALINKKINTYNGDDNAYSSSVKNGKSQLRKDKKSAKGAVKSSNLSDSLKKKIQSFIKKGKLIPESVMKQVAKKAGADSTLYSKLAGYNSSVDFVSDAIKNQTLAREQNQTNIREAKIEQHQNSANEYQSSLDLYTAQKDNRKTASDKNRVIDQEKEATKQLYAEKIAIAGLEGNINEQLKLQEELSRQLVVLEKEKFDNISHYYENLRKLNDNSYQDLNNAADELEARGLIVGSSLYSSQIALNNAKKKGYEDELRLLEQQLPNIEEGTDEWYEALDAIQACENGIAGCTKDSIQLGQAIRDVEWQLNDKISSRFDLLSSEYDLMIKLMSNKQLTDDDTGNFTAEGTATLGAYYAQLQLATQKTQSFKSTLDDMWNKLQNGEEGYTDQAAWNEYYEKYDEYIKLVETEYDVQQNLINLMKEKYEAELNCLKDIIDKRKELLQTEKDAYDYQRTIEEKTKNIGTLQKQLSALSGDDSEGAKTRIQQLKISLDEAKKDLQDTEYDQWITDQQTMLDNLYNEYSDFIDDKLNETDKLLEAAIDYLQSEEAQETMKETIGSAIKNNNYDPTTDFEKVMTSLGPDGNIVSAINNVTNTITEYFRQKQADSDEAAKVIQAISEIGQVDYDGEGRQRLVAAEKAYASLSPGAKRIVDSTSINGLSTMQQKQQEWLGTKQEHDRQVAEEKNSNARNELERILKETYYQDSSLHGGKTLWGTSKKGDGAYGQVQEKFYDHGLTRPDKKYVNAAGIKEIARRLGYPENSQTATALLNYMNSIGYSRGGVARRLQKVPILNGDNGWITIAPHERVLTEEQNKAFEKLVGNMDVLNPAFDHLSELSAPGLHAVPEYNTTSIGDIQINMELPNVTNYEEFRQKLQTDPKIETMFKSMIYDKNSFSKYKIRM